MKLLSMLLVLTLCSLAQAMPSYIFGRTPADGLGPLVTSGSIRYASTLNALINQGYRPLTETYGSTQPSDLKIVIGDASVDTFTTEVFLDTLAYEKPTLMKIYSLSNAEYNRLALMAFGIMGQETKYGTSRMYEVKESAPASVIAAKVLFGKMREVKTAVQVGNAEVVLKPVSVNPSRGLTQIKDIPYTIRSYYCFSKEDLGLPRAAAISTLGFLAESLKITRNIARNQDLSYIDDENIFDYVLYIYFGRRAQLKPPVYDSMGKPLFASPKDNKYIQHVRQNIRGLVLVENQHRPMAPPHNISCSNSPSDSN